MTFLIDGTNAVRRLYQESKRVSVKEEHQHICEFLEWMTWMASRYRSRGWRFRVAFDGPPRSFAVEGLNLLDLLYGREEGADHVLLDQARFLGHVQQRVVLVTADRELAEKGKAEGAESMRPEEFKKKMEAGDD